MAEFLQRYLPEYDDEEERLKLSSFSQKDLVDMLIIAYKSRRVLAKETDELSEKLNRIQFILAEPSKLSQMPDVPTATDLKRMTEDENDSE